MIRKRRSLLLPQDGELYWENRWEYMEDVYRVLAENLQEEPEESEQVDWQKEYLELRKILNLQARETAELFGEHRRGFPKSVQLHPTIEKKLRKVLLERRIKVDRILCTEKQGKKEIVMQVHTMKEGYMTAREAAEIVGNVLRMPLRPTSDSCVVISAADSVLKLTGRPLFEIRHGVGKLIRSGEVRSGDNYSFQKLPGGKVLLGISDGMGSGNEAFQESAKVLDCMELFLQAEFSPETAIRLVQTMLLSKPTGERKPETMDLGVVDLEEGLLSVYKNGAPATFLCRNEMVDIIRAEALPLGVLDRVSTFEDVRRLRDGDMIVMVTDGVLEALPGEDKEETLAEFLKKMPACHPRGAAEGVIQYVKECSGGKYKDDCMVLTAIVWKNREAELARRRENKLQ